MQAGSNPRKTYLSRSHVKCELIIPAIVALSVGIDGVTSSAGRLLLLANSLIMGSSDQPNDY